MQRNEWIKCPVCGGTLKLQTSIEHPKYGLINEIHAHCCLQCGKIFLSDDISEEKSVLWEDGMLDINDLC